jgi:hypothetical protein
MFRFAAAVIIRDQQAQWIWTMHMAYWLHTCLSPRAAAVTVGRLAQWPSICSLIQNCMAYTTFETLLTAHLFGSNTSCCAS